MSKLARFLLCVSLAVPMSGQEEPAGADLLIEKSGPSTATAGSNVTYSIRVVNLGPETATVVSLDDTLPGDMTFVSATQHTGPAFNCTVPAVDAGGTVSCALAAMNPGAEATFTFVFKIPASSPPGTDYTNLATIRSDTPDNNEENNTGVAATLVFAPQANVGVSKTGPSAAGEGTDVAFTITLRNSGPNAATNVTLTDTLPGDMTFVSLTQSGTALNCTTPSQGAGGTVTCTAATLAAGATSTLTLTGHIPDATPSGTTYTNTVTVTSDFDPGEENDAATHTVTVSAADVSVVKSGPAEVIAGNSIVYTLTVANAGPDPATAVVLTDPIPAGTTLRAFSKTSGPAANCSTTPTLIACELALLLPGQSAVFRLELDPGATSSVTNTATVRSETFDTDRSNQTSSVTTSVVSRADLAVAKTGPATVTAGSNVTYTVTVTNNGPSAATNVTVTDEPPANTTFVSTNAAPIPTLAAGASAVFTYTFRVSPSAAGTISNTATASSPTVDPNGGNNSSTVVSAVATSADVRVTKTGPASAAAGTNATFTVVVANDGPSDATNVVLTDVLPAGTTFVSSTQSGAPFTCVTGPTITCTAATLAASASATFNFTVAVAAGATGSVSNTATVTSSTPDPNTANNSSTAVSPVVMSADVRVTKTAPAVAPAGSNATFTVTVANDGPSDAANVVLTDVLPAGTTFVSASQSGAPFTCVTGPTITCTAATLATSASATFNFTVAVAAGATGTISNTATVTSSTPDPNTANNSSTAVSTVTTSADVRVTKTAPAAAPAGTDVTYTVTVANDGPADAANVVLTDVLPAGTTFVSSSQSGAPFTCVTGPTITCTAATLAASASTTFNFTVTIAAGATGSVSNTATVTSSTADPNNANNSATATTGLNPGTTDLSIAKSVNGSAFQPNALATFTIVATNNGPAVAFGTTVTDPLPAGSVLESYTATQGTCTGTTTVTCSVGTLAVNASATITLNVRLPRDPGTMSNTATISAANAELSADDNASTTGFAVTNEIPTMSEWALIALAAALALVAVRARLT